MSEAGGQARNGIRKGIMEGVSKGREWKEVGNE